MFSQLLPNLLLDGEIKSEDQDTIKKSYTVKKFCVKLHLL